VLTQCDWLSFHHREQILDGRPVGLAEYPSAIAGVPMWHDMFALPVPVIEKILRALFVYGFLVIALRLAGKRELAQLSTFDFVVLLSVANAVQNGIIGEDDSVTGAWIGAMTLFLANFALAFTIVRSRRLRAAAEGQPAKLVEAGEVKDDELRRVRVTHAELESAVGENGERLVDVETVELFPNGRIVVTPKDPDQLDRIERELGEIRAMLQAR